jgi:hypothetical protein
MKTRARTRSPLDLTRRNRSRSVLLSLTKRYETPPAFNPWRIRPRMNTISFLVFLAHQTPESQLRSPACEFHNQVRDCAHPGRHAELPTRLKKNLKLRNEAISLERCRPQKRASTRYPYHYWVIRTSTGSGTREASYLGMVSASPCIIIVENNEAPRRRGKRGKTRGDL